MEIGQKIKQLRIQKGLTLEELASRSELTKGFLSQVERDLTTPSIATLEDILEALGSNLSEFFREEPEAQIVFTEQDFFIDEQEEYTIQWVVPNAQKNEMEPIVLTLAPHGTSMELISHRGEEFGYVLKGSVTLVHGTKRNKLKPGDTFYLTNVKTHKLYNHGGNEAKVLLVSTPPSF